MVYLLTEVEHFLARHAEIVPRRLGMEAVGDPRLVFDMRGRNGRRPRRIRQATAVRVLSWMYAYTARGAGLAGLPIPADEVEHFAGVAEARVHSSLPSEVHELAARAEHTASIAERARRAAEEALLDAERARLTADVAAKAFRRAAERTERVQAA